MIELKKRFPKVKGEKRFRASIEKIQMVADDAVEVLVRYQSNDGVVKNKRFLFALREVPEDEVLAKRFFQEKIQTYGEELKHSFVGKDFVEKVLSEIGEIVI